MYFQVILQQDYIKQDPYSGSKLLLRPLLSQGIDPKNEVFLDTQVIAFFEEWKSI